MEKILRVWAEAVGEGEGRGWDNMRVDWTPGSSGQILSSL